MSRSPLDVRMRRPHLAWRLMVTLLFGLAAWIGLLILTAYDNYIPPSFDRGFLKNKGDYFFPSGYYLGFYAHIIGAPLALFCGMLQFSGTLRERFPAIHRWLGRLYVLFVLLLAAPGGLVMSTRAYGGWTSHLCFALIASATWICTWLAWRTARRKRFREHALWMGRSYVLILSAIFLRIFHFLLQPLGLSHEFTYQLAAWASWLVPLAALEAGRTAGRQFGLMSGQSFRL